MYNNRVTDEEENQTIRINDSLGNTWTSLPCIVESYNPVEQTISCQPAIKAIKYNGDGNALDLQLPLLIDVPVQFPSGGNIVMTFPIKKGDECIVVFSARCIDNWWAYGKVSPQFTQRMHDLSDGMAIVGISSIPRVIPNISINSVQLRTRDGNSFIELTEAGDITLKCTNLNVIGNTVFTGTVVANGHSIDETHLHKNVQSGSSNTGVVV